MIKTKNGKTTIKGNILEDVSDLTCIMISLADKRNIEFLESTCKSILANIHAKNKKDKLEKLLENL